MVGAVVKVGQGLPHAAFMQGGQNRAVHPGEPGVVGQFTEDRAVAGEKGGLVQALPAAAARSCGARASSISCGSPFSSVPSA